MYKSVCLAVISFASVINCESRGCHGDYIDNEMTKDDCFQCENRRWISYPQNPDKNPYCVECLKCQAGFGLSERCGYGAGEDADCVWCDPKEHKYSDAYEADICKTSYHCHTFHRIYIINATSESNAECGECEYGYVESEMEDNFECDPCEWRRSDPRCEIYLIAKDTTTTTTTMSKAITVENVTHHDQTENTSRELNNEPGSGTDLTAILIAVILVVGAVFSICISCWCYWRNKPKRICFNGPSQDPEKGSREEITENELLLKSNGQCEEAIPKSGKPRVHTVSESDSHCDTLNIDYCPQCQCNDCGWKQNGICGRSSRRSTMDDEVRPESFMTNSSVSKNETSTLVDTTRLVPNPNMEMVAPNPKVLIKQRSVEMKIQEKEKESRQCAIGLVCNQEIQSFPYMSSMNPEPASSRPSELESVNGELSLETVISEANNLASNIPNDNSLCDEQRQPRVSSGGFSANSRDERLRPPISHDSDATIPKKRLDQGNARVTPQPHRDVSSFKDASLPNIDVRTEESRPISQREQALKCGIGDQYGEEKSNVAINGNNNHITIYQNPPTNLLQTTNQTESQPNSKIRAEKEKAYQEALNKCNGWMLDKLSLDERDRICVDMDPERPNIKNFKHLGEKFGYSNNELDCCGGCKGLLHSLIAKAVPVTDILKEIHNIHRYDVRNYLVDIILKKNEE
ncbi:unnamed protein product [Owenia fusiformis]|uniref:Uncharacterized protein n=2 Tax=Owenia fusiformis TaxID=6347 RepID=A0A8J1TGI9_OWEFU|nr:unnamed protein product [Owenia fusiformis]